MELAGVESAHSLCVNESGEETHSLCLESDKASSWVLSSEGTGLGEALSVWFEDTLSRWRSAATYTSILHSNQTGDSSCRSFSFSEVMLFMVFRVLRDRPARQFMPSTSLQLLFLECLDSPRHFLPEIVVEQRGAEQRDGPTQIVYSASPSSICTFLCQLVGALRPLPLLLRHFFKVF